MVFQYVAEMLSPAALAAKMGANMRLSFAGGLILSLMVWRLGKFVVLPLCYPDDPKELPYWIPGHGVSFFRNSNQLLDYANTYFGNSKEPYAITVASTKLYILTNAKDIARVYKNTSTLSYEKFVQVVMRSSGSSKFAVGAMYAIPDREKEIFPNPQRKPLAKLGREIHIHQLFPGKGLDDLRSTFIKYFHRSLNLKHMARKPYTSSISKQAAVLSLYAWTSDVFICAGQEAYFGPLLAEMEPRLSWDFLTFDELTWQVLYQYPKLLASKMVRAKDEVIAGMERYFGLPVEARVGMAWFTPAMEAELRNVGINTNPRRSCFWMLSYMLFEPELLRIVRDETNDAFINGEFDVKYLEEKCPRLNSIWDEVLRLSAYSSSVRYITEDTLVGGKKLRKGNRIMVPNRQLHFEEKVFGDRVKDFRSTRFLDDYSLTRTLSWRPFGGGATLCPGRFIAKQSVISFVAMLVQRFDIALVGQQKFPRFEEGNPVLGVMSSKKGDDLSIKLTSRRGHPN